jgi:hypothetical protein
MPVSDRNVITPENFPAACGWLLRQEKPGLDVFSIAKKSGGYEFIETTFTRTGPMPTGTARFKNKICALSFEEREEPPSIYAEIKLFTGTRAPPPTNGRVLRPGVNDYFRAMTEGIAKRPWTSPEHKIGTAFLKSPTYPEAERIFNGFLEVLNPPIGMDTMHTMRGFDEARSKRPASLEEEIEIATAFLKEVKKPRSPKPRILSYDVETMHEMRYYDE